MLAKCLQFLKEIGRKHLIKVIILGNRFPNHTWKRPFDNKQTTDIDASIVTDHMMLEATELGLGTVWVCYFKPDIIKKEFELPDTLEPVNILLIGYSDEEPMPLNRHSKTRIPLSQLVSYEMLGN